MHLRSLTLVAALLLPVPLVADTVTYTYTGDDFNTDVSGAYTTSDFVTVTLTVSAPLADSTVYENYGSGNLDPLLVSWSFSDGVQSDNSTDLSASATFALITNSSGQITNWEVNDQFGEPYEKIIETYYAADDSVSQDRGIDTESGGGIAYDEGSPSTPPDFNPPGSWSESSPSSPVPEGPSFAFVLLGAACLCAAGLFRSRKRLGSLTA